jgi:TonB-dependent SusC/RagA subfamily outer membrane receptor
VGIMGGDEPTYAIMKFVCAAFAVLWLFTFTRVVAQPKLSFYEAHWSDVYKYEVRVLPRSAQLVVDTIYARAKHDNNISEAAKAIFYQVKFISALQEEAELGVVQKFKTEIAISKAPLRNILESVLAHTYWEYFQENVSNYYGRSRTREKVNAADFRTWDADQMFAEIHHHFQNSLRDEAILKKTSLTTLNEILTPAENSKVYRPYVYDLLAHMALDFYTHSESLSAQAIHAFALQDPKLFDSFDSITPPPPADSLAPVWQGVRLLKDLIAFHRQEKDTFALVDLEMERLEFLVTEGKFENSSALRIRALQKLERTYRHHPASTLLNFELATERNREGNQYKPGKNTVDQFKKREAVALCDTAITHFPKSDGAGKCARLKENILRATLSLRGEDYIPTETFTRLLVSYQNIDSLSIGIFRITADFDTIKLGQVSDATLLGAVSTLAPVAQWNAGLKNLHDYQSHSTEVVVPKLPVGKFFVLVRVVSSEKTASVFAYTTIQVTDLVLLESHFENQYRYQVVNRSTGMPIAGADVHFKTKKTATSNSLLVGQYRSDKNGFVEVSGMQGYRSGIYATVQHGKDSAEFGNYSLSFSSDDEEGEEVVVESFLFSDRGIYRPGQTVYFKGILTKKDRKKSSVLAGQWVEVLLEDDNGSEVGNLRLKSNGYGSFSGEFKLPPTGLTGEYTLTADEDMEEDSHFYDEEMDDFVVNELTILVEEYKRPTFEVSFQPVTQTFIARDTVTLKGTALSFSGAKVSGAKFTYHVDRNVRFPGWYYWSHSYAGNGHQVIALGEGVTDAAGEFSILFAATPDESISKKEHPLFLYEVTVDVTDMNGETRTASFTVKVGYTAMIATVNAPARMNRKDPSQTIVVGTENQNGQFVPAKGNIAIYKLKYPATAARPRPWSAPDIPPATEDAFHKLFPHDFYGDDQNTKALQKEKRMAEFQFDTGVAKEIPFKPDQTWANGTYVIELTTLDVSGDTLIDLHRFTLYDPSSKSVDDNQLLFFEMDKPSYAVGDVAKIRIGSAATDITITIDIEKNNKIVKTYVDHFSGNVKEYTVPVTESTGAGFAVHYSAACYNTLLTGGRTVQIESPRKKLEIETVTFKDKLQPGGKETWSFAVTGDDIRRKHTEVLASMYDASLDQFAPHAWRFDPVHSEGYYSSFRMSGEESFNTSPFTIRNDGYGFYSVPRQYYDALYLFGFGIRNQQYSNRLYLDRLYFSGTTANHPSKVSLSNNRNGSKGFIYGRVSMHDGESLAGVNIVIQGTTQGTVTDARGEYFIAADRGDTLVFSFVGFSGLKTAVGRKNVMNVTLEEEIMQLSEVLVTGYGITERKYLSGSVSVVKREEGDIVAYALQGKVAGIQISGLPGGPAYLRIRGASSIDNNAKALYVVDGVVVESMKIDQADVADVVVLKGDAAVSLYGSRAINGVIVLTTKSGQKKLDDVMAKINARKNFNETAFFFPHLNTDENGKIQFTFTTPEALTRWKLQLLGHTRDLVTVTQTLQAVTQKELMVTPNMPRFLREGDDVILSVKIANLTTKNKEGKVALQLTNPMTGAAADVRFANLMTTKPFKVAAKGNTEVSWKLHVPDHGAEAVQYKVVAKAGAFSDGEQDALPVLSNRMLVTESLPMFVRAGQTKTFTLEKLKTTNSPTLLHHQVTLEVTSNPAWLAVKSLPYLMEFPHECAEQLFARYYANTLGSYVANHQPKVKEVFAAWSAAGTLTSNLEKNPELKSIIIQETPWLRDAQSEGEQSQRLGLLFDLSNMKAQSETVVRRLEQMQLSDGGFPWFAGDPHASRYITQHVACGYGHLKQLHVVAEHDAAATVVHKAIDFLDAQIISDYEYRRMQAGMKLSPAKDSEKVIATFLNEQRCSHEQIQYLYMRSFFPDVAVSGKLAPVLDYYRTQTARYWPEADLYLKGMIALIQHRQGDRAVARSIVASLKETSLSSDEMGMYWKENTPSWYWYGSPVETQALMIEVFNEIEGADQNITAEQKTKTLDELRIWLLKNKQTSQWKTTKATTEAIYALLLNGSDWLPLHNTLDVTVGTKKITPETKSPEAGTGYFKTSWKGEDVTPALSTVTLTKKENGVAWGGLYWQYFEDLDKITPAETPLKLSKKLFLVNWTDRGELLTEVTLGSASLHVGELLRVRIELKADRHMEFLHMKDMRAAGLEPVDVLSEYKWQGGLGYYQSTKDAATHFFFDTMEKGVYVFEYDLRVNNAGNFSNGITTIQSMYAPEFTSHSEGVRIEVER